MRQQQRGNVGAVGVAHVALLCVLHSKQRFDAMQRLRVGWGRGWLLKSGAAAPGHARERHLPARIQMRSQDVRWVLVCAAGLSAF
jgi:hypothetical protein